MRLAQTAAFAALAFLALITRADAGPTGTWFGVAASVSPAGATQTFSVQATPAAGTNINVTVVYSCAGHPNCTFTSVAGFVPPNMYIVTGLPASAPRTFFIVLPSGTNCQIVYGATSLTAVWAGGGAEMGECMAPPTFRAPSGGGTPHPVAPPQIRLPRIPPYVERPTVPPTPNPGPIPPH